MEGLLGVLRREGVVTPNDKAAHISRRSLLRYLRETEEYADFYNEFAMELFHWCRTVYQGKSDEAYHNVKEFRSKTSTSAWQTIPQSEGVRE